MNVMDGGVWGGVSISPAELLISTRGSRPVRGVGHQIQMFSSDPSSTDLPSAALTTL